jgi:hypothetical protein
MCHICHIINNDYRSWIINRPSYIGIFDTKKTAYDVITRIITSQPFEYFFWELDIHVHRYKRFYITYLDHLASERDLEVRFIHCVDGRLHFAAGSTDKSDYRLFNCIFDIIEKLKLYEQSMVNRHNAKVLLYHRQHCEMYCGTIHPIVSGCLFNSLIPWSRFHTYRCVNNKKVFSPHKLYYLCVFFITHYFVGQKRISPLTILPRPVHNSIFADANFCNSVIVIIRLMNQCEN